MRRFWTADDEATLRRLYPNTQTAAIAKQLRRTLSTVYQHARKIGLRKSDAYLASPDACRLRRGDNVGAATRFAKGQAPPNKGLRRPGWHRGRMQETQFKKGTLNGHAAQHCMTIGSTRLIDGYVYRKVSEVPNVPYTVNWKPEHVLLWERERGPVPKGSALAFLNGDKQDIRLDNMECITRRELMLRNTVHRLPKELARTVQLLGALNRQIRRRTRGQEQDRRSAESPL